MEKEKTYSPADFLTAMEKDELQGGGSLVGMVKAAHDDKALMFSVGRSCTKWTKIPLEYLDTVEYLYTAPCKDHEHPVVRLFFKGQSGPAGVILGLLRAVAGQPEAVLLPAPLPGGPPGGPPFQPRPALGTGPFRRSPSLAANDCAPDYHCIGGVSQCPYGCACYDPFTGYAYCSLCCIGRESGPRRGRTLGAEVCAPEYYCIGGVSQCPYGCACYDPFQGYAYCSRCCIA